MRPQQGSNSAGTASTSAVLGLPASLGETGLGALIFTTSNQTIVTATDSNSKSWTPSSTGGKLHLLTLPWVGNGLTGTTSVTVTLPISDNWAGITFEGFEFDPTTMYDAQSGAQVSEGSGVSFFTAGPSGPADSPQVLAIAFAGTFVNTSQFPGRPYDTIDALSRGPWKLFAGSGITAGAVDESSGIGMFAMYRYLTEKQALIAKAECIAGATPFSKIVFIKLRSGNNRPTYFTDYAKEPFRSEARGYY